MEISLEPQFIMFISFLMMVVGVFAIYLSCLMNNESMLFVFGTNIQNMLVTRNTFCFFIGITSLFSLILSEFAELKVLLYRNRFGKILDFIGIRGAKSAILSEFAGANSLHFTIFATMMENDWKKRLGVVYSTDPNFKYEQEAEPEVETLEPAKQNLIVAIDRRARAGKQVTLVKGFVGSESDLATLGKSLKVKCGVGGTAKDGEITLQGDLRDKVVALLQSMGYRAKRGN